MEARDRRGGADGYDKGGGAAGAPALVLVAVTPACPGVEHTLAAGYDPVE